MDIPTVVAVVICYAWVITTEEIHVVFVNNWAMIRNRSWNVISVACCLHEPPFMATNELRIAFFLWQFVKALQVQFVERSQWAFTNVETSIDVKFSVKYEAAVITAPIWLLVLEPHFIPELQVIRTSNCAGWALELLSVLVLGFTRALSFFDHHESIWNLIYCLLKS